MPLLLFVVEEKNELVVCVSAVTQEGENSIGLTEVMTDALIEQGPYSSFDFEPPSLAMGTYLQNKRRLSYTHTVFLNLMQFALNSLFFSIYSPNRNLPRSPLLLSGHYCGGNCPPQGPRGGL